MNPAGLTLTLLTRSCCHLCDEMLEAVKPLAGARGVAIAVVDVDGDPALEATYGDRVPVLFAGEPSGGIELCHFRLDPARLDEAMAGSGQHAE